MCWIRPAPAWAAGCCGRGLLRPCLQLEEIEARLDAVQAALQATIARSETRKLLANILDLERLLAKLTLGTAGPRELLALGRSLALVPKLKEQAAGFDAARMRAIAERAG